MEIQNWNDVIGKPSIIAEFDLYVPEWQMTIKTMKVVRSKNGKCFATLPSYSKEVDGVRKYFPIIVFSLERQQKFNEAVQKLLDPYLNKGSYHGN